ncbi:nucleotide-binding universal stress UspA family protein [Aquimarina sp. EL_43]|uniref:universal stress protein n=1 Tax=Aquimarina TaxID=290174 RepID=UPI000472C6C5|nr:MULTISPECIES: universal stress protein [Aquimarina]MBG6131875.1 nucleotide-binding universal stress UspA family protein [Aquimarina sp. EL_35]MBG6149439.1 nucleotide-binding universal stress UspA family protein [Aquimarina sp. EL_32]MBG6170298.1 nucleotide-binding universal stress UspA family protein [Aquimarina sp. EL_43]
MKKILVPIDFSEYSEYALQVAALLAKQQNAEIIVLHMLGLSEAVLIKNETQEANEAMYYMKLAEKRFSTFLDKEYLKGIQVTETVQNYKIFSEINEVAHENEADLIVMGSHGVSGLREEVFIGSNTEKVVRTSDIPVLVIKNPVDNFALNEVVFACDFKIENIKAYHNAIKLFNALDANIHLLYVNLPGEQFRSSDQIEERVKEFLFKADSGNLDMYDKVTYFNDYSVESGVFNYSKKINADIIAIPTHGRRGLAHFFNGSIGEDIANHANKPVITFKI